MERKEEIETKILAQKISIKNCGSVDQEASPGCFMF